jgi:hypothetical protein
MSELREAALAYHAAGLHPIPVEPCGKRPLVKWQEYQLRQPTVAEIERWWGETPDANVGLACGRGMFVLDIDGPEGMQALIDAGVDPASLGAAPRVVTGKGQHIYLAGDVPDRIGVLPKVDIRSDGGFVVAPPSVHASGRRYEWAGGLFGTNFPPAPPALQELLARPTKPTLGAQPADAGWVSTALLGVGEGGRDNTCTRLAGYFLGRGLPVDVVETILVEWGERCSPAFPADAVAKCIASIAKRHEPAAAVETYGVAAVVGEALAEIKVPPAERKLRPTELPGLDKLLSGGFEPGEFVLFGARPGVGKTALALQIARKVAENGAPVLIDSREMRRTAVVRRLLVQLSGVRASDVKSGQLVEMQWKSLAWAASYLATLPIHLTNARSVEELREVASAVGALGLIVVDYLQLMKTAFAGENKRSNVEAVSEALKALAVDFDVPVLCLSSLRRLTKAKDGTREKPDMSDLRESGALEHDGDIVMLMAREFDSDVCDLVIAKNRDGRVGDLKLRFRGDLMRFEEMTA